MITSKVRPVNTHQNLEIISCTSYHRCRWQAIDQLQAHISLLKLSCPSCLAEPNKKNTTFIVSENGYQYGTEAHI